MSNFKEAIVAWRLEVGDGYVLIDGWNRSSYQTATFETTQQVPAVVRPGSRDEVQACVKIAAKYRIPVYPVSRGRNWGLGSKVPVASDCVVLDLGRMDQIIDYNEELSYITVQPGVTFEQVSKFLKERGSDHYLAAIGGPPDASLIGNLVERGDGVGPSGERLTHACNLEIVLPTGKQFQTGFGRYESSVGSAVHRWGVGPSFDSMFTQSNFGIVTQATFWLTATPEHFEVILFGLPGNRELLEVCKPLKRLMADGIIKPNSIAIWNKHKFVASQAQYPWESTEGKTPLPESVMDKIAGPWKRMGWIGLIGVYSPTRAHAKASRKLIRSCLKPHTNRIISITKTKARLLNFFKKPLERLTGKNIGDLVRALHDESVFLGYPTNESVKGTYWRKKAAPPVNPDLDRDNCGVIWLCPLVPFTGNDIAKSVQIINDSMSKHSFEPVLAITFPSSRCAYVLPTILYDRDLAGEDTRALVCHDELISTLNMAGYLPHRLGIQSMNSLPTPSSEYAEFWQSMKSAIDPHGIMSPGRYEFRIAENDSTPVTTTETNNTILVGDTP